MNTIMLWLRRAIVLGAVAASFWIMFLGGSGPLNTTLAGIREALYSTLASILATLLAFVFAAESVLLGLASNARLAVITKSNRFSDLTAVFASAIRSLGIATIAAILALMFDREKSPSPVFACILLNALAWALADAIRSVYVFEKIRLLIVSPSKARSGSQA